MNDPQPMDRREALSGLLSWSAAALALAGLPVGCTSGGSPGQPRSYRDYADYADYFDYANYADYADHGYADYGDYANYANYGDYFDYADGYGDGYSDYANYADYVDYWDYSDYQDYGDYGDYSDYADFAKTYVDAGPNGLRPPLGRVGVSRPREGRAHQFPAGGRDARPGPDWREPAERPDRSADQTIHRARKPVREPAPDPGERLARQGTPGELTRPSRQLPGRRTRRRLGQPEEPPAQPPDEP